MSLKNTVTPPGIDPGTVILVRFLNILHENNNRVSLMFIVAFRCGDFKIYCLLLKLHCVGCGVYKSVKIHRRILI